MKPAVAIIAVFVIAICSSIILFSDSDEGTATGNWKEWKNVLVLSGEFEGETDNWLQLEDGRVMWGHFCHPTPFIKGMILDDVKYENRVSCLSLRSPGGYSIRRYHGGVNDAQPVYAKR